jgi:hypothetical protein
MSYETGHIKGVSQQFRLHYSCLFVLRLPVHYTTWNDLSTFRKLQNEFNGMSVLHGFSHSLQADTLIRN